MPKKTSKPAKSRKIKKAEEVQFECLTFKQAAHELVVFLCSAKDLWRISKINRRDENDDKRGYQRAVSGSRTKKIATFIDDGNLIPNSVLVSFDKARLSRDKKKIFVEKSKDSGWIIDGQHRLVGGFESQSDIILPVVALLNLEIEEQINCFVTINKEQKGVPSSLYLELLENLPGIRNATADAKQRAVDLSRLLKNDEDSPFYGRIVSTTSPKDGQVSVVNFVRKVHPHLRVNGGRLSNFNDDERRRILNNYYDAIRLVFEDEYDLPKSVFFRTIGFGALIDVLPTIMDLTTNEFKGSFKKDQIATILQRVEHFNFSEFRGLTGSAAEKTVGTAFRTELTAFGNPDGITLDL